MKTVEELAASARDVMDKFFPRDDPRALEGLMSMAILLLDDVRQSIGFGKNYAHHDPKQLVVGPPVLLLEKSSDSRPRFVEIALDAVADGAVAPPTVRYAINNQSISTANGVQLTAGVLNRIGLLGPNDRVYVVTDQPITIYLITRG